ncbi:MAG: penicillin-binding protein 2 [Cyanothece sp. SIO2G6]|nr:penicillin-binding protein 2 [Cyanothece sp. SIO2G6]
MTSIPRLSDHAATSPRNSGRTVGKYFQSVFIMGLISFVLAGGVGSRLFYLQLVQGDRNRQLADDNRIRLLPKPPERGRILDRAGNVLAENRVSYGVYFWPFDSDEANREELITRLAKILELPSQDIRDRLEQAGDNSPTLVRIARDVGPRELTALLEYQSELPGVQIEAETERVYPNGDLAAHVLGYTGEINEEDLDDLRDQGYRLGDIVGQSGAEIAFEADLRGEWGGQQVEVDGTGQVLQVLGEKPPQRGSDVYLTLDLALQKAAEQALGDLRGAVVAIDPRNGAVRAMVSRPTYDPNVFATSISREEWQRLQQLEFPLVNRALQGFPPASTFKFVTTSAAIESGTYSPNAILPTFAYYEMGGIRFGDWNRAGFGPLGFVGAIAWSSDTFFYQTAVKMGGETLIDWTRRYGFGEKTGIELWREEAAGLVPDDAWKRENIGEPWYPGDSINMSIGQGYLLASPLQVAVMFAVVANGGDLVTPHVLYDGDLGQNWRTPIGISDVTMQILEDGARRVLTGGTGIKVNSPLVPLAGKSGTAEDPPRLSHAWFGAYGPYNDPQREPEIVVVAFGENSGGGGSGTTGPIVREILEAYFEIYPYP